MEYTTNKNNLEKLFSGKSGVYIYSFRGQAIYVGATKDVWKRTFRIFKNSQILTPMLGAILGVIGHENTIIEILICEKEELRFLESKTFNNRTPMSQMLIEHRLY